MLTLIMLNGPKRGAIFQLTGGEPEVIGRQAPVIRVVDSRVSRRHAQIRETDGGWVLEDLQSSNGTFLNNARIDEPETIHEGDRIQIGRVALLAAHVTAGSPVKPHPRPAPMPAFSGAPRADVHPDAPLESVATEDALPQTEQPELAAEAPAEAIAATGPASDVEASVDEDVSIDAEVEAAAATADLPDLDEESFEEIDLDALIGEAEAPEEAAVSPAEESPPAELAEEPPEAEIGATESEPVEAIEPPAEAEPEPREQVVAEDDVADDEPALPEATVPDADLLAGLAGAAGATSAAEMAEEADPLASLAALEAELDADYPGDAASPPSDADKRVLAANEDADETDGDDASQANEEAAGEVSGLPGDADEVAADAPAETVEPAAAASTEAADEPRASDEQAAAELEAEEAADEPDDDGPEFIFEAPSPVAAPSLPSDGGTWAADPASEGLDPVEAVLSAGGAMATGEVGTESADASMAATALATDAPSVSCDEPEAEADDVPALDSDEGAPQPDEAAQAVELEDTPSPELTDSAESDELDDEPVAPLALDDDAEQPTEESADSGVLHRDAVASSEAAEAEADHRRAYPDVGRPSRMFDPDRRERALAKAESDAREDRLHRRRSLVLPTIVVLLFALAGVAFVFMILRGNFGSPQAGFATSGLEDRAAESANQPSDAAGDARAAEAAPPAEPAAKTPPRPRLTTPRPPQPEPADAAPPAVSPFADQNNQRLLPDGEQATNPAATASLAPTPPARTPAGAPDRPQTGEPSASSAPAAEAATEPAGLSEVDQQVASALRESITADEAIVPAPAATRPLHQALEQAPPPMADAPNGKVAFLVDMSGSLIDTLPDVITWLNGRLAELPPDRQFTIIFFRDGTSTEVPPAGLRPATDATRGSAKRWMRPSSANIAAHGRSDATEAIELALSYGVGEICILSDDAFGRRAGSTGRAAIIDRIRTTIGDRRVQIHATQFFYEDADQTLEVLTEEFGGRYEFIPPGRETNEPAINLLDPLSHAEN